MEIFELKYFFAVAENENVHRASERLHVSPGSLSKAVARLEAELGTQLFSRQGRGIMLTESGRRLFARARDLIRMEEATRLDVGNQNSALRVTMIAPETLLCGFAASLLERIRKRHPRAEFDFVAGDDETTVKKVISGDAHIGITTRAVTSPLRAKLIGTAHFVTVVGRGHPLYAAALARKSMPIGELLEYEFVSSDRTLFGKVGARQSPDGWRDDKFQRRIGIQATSLSLLLHLASAGKVVAYIPGYLVAGSQLAVVPVRGCPYTCVQKISLVARRPHEVSWLNRLFR